MVYVYSYYTDFPLVQANLGRVQSYVNRYITDLTATQTEEKCSGNDPVDSVPEYHLILNNKKS